MKRGSEHNNVKETWEQNERLRQNVNREDPAEESELQKTIHEEAAEYDHSNKEDRILGGDRASLNDDEDPDG